MESQGAAGKPWAPKLTLETYLNLSHLDTISSTELRKIITMHGFNSIKVPKKDLMDAVRSIELMDVHRSTLENDFVSSDVSLSLNDVIEDLSDIHWQECCITSVQTFGFRSKDNMDDVAACSSTVTVTDNGDHKNKKSKITVAAKPPLIFTYAQRKKRKY